MKKRNLGIQFQTERFKNHFRILKEQSQAQAPFYVVVKANAYGVGLASVVQTLNQESFTGFGVAFVEEGLRLRALEPNKKILVFSVRSKADFECCVQNRLTPVISSIELVESLKGAKFEKKVSVHLKIDTGMGRMGVSPQDWKSFVSLVESLPFLQIEGVMTHLAEAERVHEANSLSFQQVETFLNLTQGFSAEVERHCFNSAGFLNQNKGAPRPQVGSGIHLGARVGIALYEGIPNGNNCPVIDVTSQLARVYWAEKGSSVSYGATWRAPSRTLIGVVPIGYADGLHRATSNRGYVLVGGQRCAMIGTICMDYFMIDLTPLHHSPIDAIQKLKVTLLGQDEFKNVISATEFGQWSNTISWEVLTSFGGPQS